MSVRLVSFDAAETLLRVNWQPGRFAVDRAEELGIPLDRQVAEEVYDRLLASRFEHYRSLNLRVDGRDNVARCDEFWESLTQDWLESFGHAHRSRDLVAHANARLLSADSPVYSVFEDVTDCLSSIRAAGIPMVILSNWDFSLHRVLQSFGLSGWFEHVFASQEYGPEKPDVELFRIVERTMGFSQQDILHIGDNALDDLQGALGAGWRAALIDRTLPRRDGPRLSTLREVPDLL